MAVEDCVRLRPRELRSAGGRSAIPAKGGAHPTAGGLILSDGTAELRYLDPETFRAIRRVTVTDGGVPVDKLNELECVSGEMFANVWQTERSPGSRRRLAESLGGSSCAG